LLSSGVEKIAFSPIVSLFDALRTSSVAEEYEIFVSFNAFDTKCPKLLQFEAFRAINIGLTDHFFYF